VPRYGVALVADVMDLGRATLHRRLRPKPDPKEHPLPAWTLSLAEELEILALLNSDRFVDTAPPEVVATLLDEGQYLGSIRTFYRVLAKHQELRERRNQLIHPVREIPRLVATGPNQVWSWDITKLKGPLKWQYYYLYVILDIYSRYVVGWMLALRESAELAKRLVDQACENQGIVKGQVTLHSDLGSPMKALPFINLTGKLGITNSFSRPRVSDDNPYSEAHFKTFKYRPDFPGRFGGFEDCDSHCYKFFGWYASEHRHSGIAFLTPEMVHYGKAEAVMAQRQRVLDEAYLRHPERFGKPPKTWQLPREVWINNPAKSASPLGLVA